MILRLAPLTCLFFLLSTAVTHAQERAPDHLQQTIEKAADLYASAFGESDAEALSLLFTEEAEYVNLSDVVFHGRSAIKAELEAGFEESPSKKIKIEILSIRPVARGIVIEEGVSTLLDDNGASISKVHYTATHAEQPDGSWLLASVRELKVVDLTPHESLMSLAWLVGDWHEDSQGSSIKTSWAWSDDESFLVSHFSLVSSGGLSKSGTHIVGWDAPKKQFRSWIFEASGESVEGWWTLSSDNSWTLTLQQSSQLGTGDSIRLNYSNDRGDGLVIRQDRLSSDGTKLSTVSRRLVKLPPVPSGVSQD